jgi:sterol desaturase/sphingolipid hydroxylase (fatty acid hydroxylase superfamily)
MGLDLGFIAIAFVCGLVAWTFAEYVMHRFVFHYHPSSEFGKRIHFIFHGIHHDYPNDSLRLVLPPSVSIPLALLFYLLFTLILPSNWLFPFFAGFILGYLCYDMMHYAIHHANIKGKWWNDIRSHHLKHHYQDDESGFGVSSPLWDLIFGSNFKQKV